jgi:hypothetical protein
MDFAYLGHLVVDMTIHLGNKTLKLLLGYK